MSQEPLSKRFGEIVRQRRLRAGLSQEGLAFRADLSTTYISRLERGLRNPSMLTVARIADALGTTMTSLVSAWERSERKARKG